MSLSNTIEHALAQALADGVSMGTPPGLMAAMHHALFSGGGRVRPRLVLQVSRACGNLRPRLAVAAAVAVELVHCASLVHDDMPAFDDADTRRGLPTVHRAYGEARALLAGDALITLAFETLANAAEEDPRLAARMVGVLARGVGPSGIIGGQAWECETSADIRRYHRMKTGALFEAAAMLGALAGGGDPSAWAPVGAGLGEAYQVADDLSDDDGEDLELHRPNAAIAMGRGAALERFEGVLRSTLRSVPDCSGRDQLLNEIAGAASRLLPQSQEQAAGA